MVPVTFHFWLPTPVHNNTRVCSFSGICRTYTRVYSEFKECQLLNLQWPANTTLIKIVGKETIRTKSYRACQRNRSTNSRNHYPSNAMGLGWQKRVFQFTGAAPLPENLWVAGIPPMVMAFMIGGIIIILSVLAFSILIAAMPRSGGGYVVISRLVSPLWAFVGSWFEFLSICVVLRDYLRSRV